MRQEHPLVWIFGLILIVVILVCLGLMAMLFQARIDTFDARLFATMTAVYTQ